MSTALPSLLSLLGLLGAQTEPPAPDFAAVRAVLERRCLQCHGGGATESEFSFADAETFRRGGARGVVVRGDEPERSRLLEVTSYRNPDLAMPPSGVLPEEERALLRSWVLAGAPWPAGPEGVLAEAAAAGHHRRQVSAEDPWWAYEPLIRPEVPASPAAGDTEHPVDAFLRERLAAAGLSTAPPAGADVLLRRATFALTGLPPSVEEGRGFRAAVTEHGLDAAYSALLDRLFASPHYAEAQARRWLDLVRYAETNGYERDAAKTNLWRYRDFVVRAIEGDLPYDRFVQWQLAGDEYAAELEDPDERAEAQLATGYYRLGVWDDEPADPDQARADELADIVDTTAQVFLASTLGCARCHDHKADPFAQREYYAFTALWNGVEGFGGGEFGQALGGGRTTSVRDPSAMPWRAAAERDAELAALERELEQLARELAGPGESAPSAPQLVAEAGAGSNRWRFREGQPEPDFAAATFDDAHWNEGPGGFGSPGTPGARIGTPWHSPRLQLRQTFGLEQLPGALWLRLHHDEDVVISLNGQVVFERRGYTTEYLDLELPAAALAALVVGRNVVAVDCTQTGGGQYLDLGLYGGPPPPSDGAAAEPAGAAAVERLLAERHDAAAERGRALLRRRSALAAEPLREPYPAQVVRERGGIPAPQPVLLRGSVHAPGEFVEPGLPRALVRGARPGSAALEQPAPDPQSPSSGRRRAFAEWLFDGGAHLAARVEANRIWQRLFGRGLCPTPGDFGRLGEAPTHPELLEFLACELIARQWSRRSLERWLMESAAYRRSSAADVAGLALDPRNQLLAYFPPRRLAAEEYRDAVLATSGSLSARRFGPSDFPPLPAEVLASSSRPDQAWGPVDPEAPLRRSLYVHSKRSLREPLLAVLDQPDPDLPCPERFATNVPTQALLTLNGEFTGSQAQAFASALAREAEGDAAQVALGLERALGRPAEPAEVARSVAFLERLRSAHGLDGERALALFALGLFNRNEFTWLD
jgi:hypothetical protein